MGAKWMLLWLDYLKWYALIVVSSDIKVSDFVNAPVVSRRHYRSQVQEIDLLSGLSWKLRTILQRSGYPSYEDLCLCELGRRPVTVTYC